MTRFVSPAVLAIVASIAACASFTTADSGAGDAGALPDAASDASAGDAAVPEGGAQPLVGYPAAILADRPLGYWRLGESIGPVAKDETGHFDGRYAGACALGVPGAVASDTAAHLDGKSCTVDLGDTFRFTKNAPFSIEAWVLPDPTATAFLHIFTREVRQAGPADGYAMVLESRMAAYAERAENGSNQRTPGTPVPQNAFAHLVATYDGATLRMYVDGKADTKAVVGDSASMNDVVAHAFIGSTGTGNFFNGTIDEVAIYDKALTPAQVQAHHDAASR
ncbi:MAG: hypothetical protein QOI41_2323 [Myxococcales bacterium]|jgi:hypothetical protein|nr:hypothetical protein [Myxococcales bacterium]